jgi:hypothetical protein
VVFQRRCHLETSVAIFTSIFSAVRMFCIGDRSVVFFVVLGRMPVQILFLIENSLANRAGVFEFRTFAVPQVNLQGFLAGEESVASETTLNLRFKNKDLKLGVNYLVHMNLAVSFVTTFATILSSTSDSTTSSTCILCSIFV